MKIRHPNIPRHEQDNPAIFLVLRILSSAPHKTWIERAILSDMLFLLHFVPAVIICYVSMRLHSYLCRHIDSNVYLTIRSWSSLQKVWCACNGDLLPLMRHTLLTASIILTSKNLRIFWFFLHLMFIVLSLNGVILQRAIAYEKAPSVNLMGEIMESASWFS